MKPLPLADYVDIMVNHSVVKYPKSRAIRLQPITDNLLEQGSPILKHGLYKFTRKKAENALNK